MTVNSQDKTTKNQTPSRYLRIFRMQRFRVSLRKLQYPRQLVLWVFFFFLVPVVIFVTKCTFWYESKAYATVSCIYLYGKIKAVYVWPSFVPAGYFWDAWISIFCVSCLGVALCCDSWPRIFPALLFQVFIDF